MLFCPEVKTHIHFLSFSHANVRVFIEWMRMIHLYGVGGVNGRMKFARTPSLPSNNDRKDGKKGWEFGD